MYYPVIFFKVFYLYNTVIVQVQNQSLFLAIFKNYFNIV